MGFLIKLDCVCVCVAQLKEPSFMFCCVRVPMWMPGCLRTTEPGTETDCLPWWQHLLGFGQEKITLFFPRGSLTAEGQRHFPLVRNKGRRGRKGEKKQDNMLIVLNKVSLEGRLLMMKKRFMNFVVSN